MPSCRRCCQAACAARVDRRSTPTELALPGGLWYNDKIKPWGFPPGFVLYSAVGAQEKERQGTGAGVRADDGSYIIDLNLRHMVLLPQKPGQIFRVLAAVAMADEHGLLFRLDGRLPHLGRHGLDGGLASPRLGHGHQMAVVVHVHHGLDLQETSHDGGGAGDAAAPLEEHEVIHREPVAQMELVGLGIVPRLLQRGAGQAAVGHMIAQ